MEQNVENKDIVFVKLLNSEKTVMIDASEAEAVGKGRLFVDSGRVYILLHEKTQILAEWLKFKQAGPKNGDEFDMRLSNIVRAGAKFRSEVKGVYYDSNTDRWFFRPVRNGSTKKFKTQVEAEAWAVQHWLSDSK